MKTKKAVKILGYSYIPQEQINTQGKSRNINKYTKNGYRIVCEKNGFWVLAKDSKAIVKYEINGVVAQDNVKELIREHYGKQRVTKKQFENFIKDYKEGKFDLGCSGGKLHLI